MINYNFIKGKKKGILDIKVERNMGFERNIDSHYLYSHLKDLRREVAFLLNRMKSHIKKGYKPKKQVLLQNYRQRFQKLMSYIVIWRHYILLYYKEREAQFYEKLYEKGDGKSKDASSRMNYGMGSGSQTVTNLTDKLTNSKYLAQKSPEQEGHENDFDKINIAFFIEEFFLYILEVLHATAGMAYT